MTTLSRDRYLANAGEHFDATLRRATCESEIESAFMAEAIVRGWGYPCDYPNAAWHWAWDTIAKSVGKDSPVLQRLFSHHEMGVLITQLPIKPEGRAMRLDFAFFLLSPESSRVHHAVNVEVDGHEFHERTKEQAHRDRSRDRLLQRHKWSVVRFTGSEIYRDVTSCWDEFDNLLKSIYLGQKAAG